MAKGVIMYIILTIAFVTLNRLHPSRRSDKGNRHIRLFEGMHFDPLVTKFEHRVEGIDFHESRGCVHGFAEAEEVTEAEVTKADAMYFGKDGKLNLTLRLTTLFPIIDTLPKDGYVEFRELEAWNVMQANERLDYSTTIEFEFRDKNKDGLISFNEFFPHFSIEEPKTNKMGHGEPGWWMEQFTNADADQDGNMSLEELKDFLHPEDSIKNVNVQEWFLREKIRTLDWDNDGKLNFQEFRNNAYDTFKTYYEFSSGNGYVPSPEHQFSDLDLNNDRLLTIQDLKPIKKYLFPGILDHASYYATYLINEVDDNHDKKLTIEEILNHEDKFYKSVYVGEEEYRGMDDHHDEF